MGIAMTFENDGAKGPSIYGVFSESEYFFCASWRSGK